MRERVIIYVFRVRRRVNLWYTVFIPSLLRRTLNKSRTTKGFIMTTTRKPSVIVKCETCGIAFKRKQSKLSEHNFCSRACIRKEQHRKGEVKHCEICNKSFYKEPSKAEGRFCSKKCAGVYHSQHFRNGLERACDGCGKMFYIYPSQQKRNKRFCSRKCQGETRSVVCSICGITFLRKTSQLQGVEHPCCGMRCIAELQRRRMTGEGSPTWKGGLVTVPCEACGAELQRETNQLQRGRSFCNMICKGVWMARNLTGEAHPRWQGGGIEYYGPNWLAQRRAARERDKHRCRHCRITEKKLDRELDVHHIQPFRTFGYIPDQNDHYLAANTLSNLISLCPTCHRLAEHAHIPMQLGLC